MTKYKVEVWMKDGQVLHYDATDVCFWGEDCGEEIRIYLVGSEVPFFPARQDYVEQVVVKINHNR